MAERYSRRTVRPGRCRGCRQLPHQRGRCSFIRLSGAVRSALAIRSFGAFSAFRPKRAIGRIGRLRRLGPLYGVCTLGRFRSVRSLCALCATGHAGKCARSQSVLTS